ncbi:Farnesyl diphosphate synthase [Orchesella cincta]|uniref:Farnesyl pyrophosphate synthase n=1 Tax=Orchesella cincta TaxID=48709 RepID=A0A1D2MDQ8_ORCCI|nr:Farnesyl diphosphate synthase [Orchesella cincta]
MVHQAFGNLTAVEVYNFKKHYSILVEALDSQFRIDNFPCAPWIKKLLNYNVPHGKQLRGLFVPMTVKCFDNQPKNELMEQAYVLGWCIEMFQAFCLVADDIMDRSETRRGQPCWYRVDDIGVLAVNDSFLIEHTLYRILAKHFGTHPRYANFLDLFLETSYKTVLGQCLDTETERNRQNPECYSMERYKKIVEFKTSYYTIYLPMAVAVILLKNNDKHDLLKKVEDVAKVLDSFPDTRNELFGLLWKWKLVNWQSRN